jgi:hypothetical protein
MAESRTHSDLFDEATSAVRDRDSYEFAHALLFTGHMIDRPGRARPRFPAWAERRVREAIRRALENISWIQSGSTVGLAGAASGGDLLFHEVCEELSLPTRVLLALPPMQFIEASVAPAGPSWVDRFNRLLEQPTAHTVSVMPGDASDSDDIGIWERANLWMVEQAVAIAPDQALLALWDGSVGDGPGGTEHFIQVARWSGLRVLEPIAMQTILQR